MTNFRRMLDMVSCPVCGSGHPDLPFWQNLDSRNLLSNPEWIGLCPEEGEPLAITRDLEGEKTTVAIESGARKGLSG